MRASLENLLRDNAAIAPESLVCPHIPYGSTHDAVAAAQWFEYATDPAILDMVEQLIGPDIVLWGSQVFCKPAHTGKEIPWHQDGRYWPIRPLATCSVWIAIDDVGPTRSMKPLILTRCDENVERLCSIDCSSPMSAKIF